MGLIRAAFGSIGGAAADQWKEYFYCESMPANVLVAKGEKRVSGRSSNRHGSDNIITDGSVIAVADGQCMMIVADGRLVEICAEAGEFTYNSGTQPSFFSEGLGEGFNNFWATVGERFAFGGEANSDQRVYYFNTKEIMGNKYGTANPVPFRVVDNNIGLDIDISIRCNGEYSYRITNPVLFYTNVCGNVAGSFTRDQIDSQLKTELLTALQPAFANISERGIRYSALPGHTIEIAQALNSVLSSQWKEHRGIEIAAFGVNSVNASKEDEQLIKELQRNAVMRNPNMAAATLVGAQAQAMQDAAKNTGGAPMAFMGMNMAQNAGGMNAQSLFDMGAQQQAAAAPNPDAWQCGCGVNNTGKFCAQCGTPRPAPAGAWQCSCGAQNTGKFCAECGTPRPASDEWDCSCGAKNSGKFCAQCGKAKG
ncbi:MAG: SPFH domain-containing protein [Faecalibacterium sp.]